jgi:multiple antibiotic resistance protein
MDAGIEAPGLIAVAIALLTITNPIGSVPIFLGLTAGFDAAKQRRTALLVGVAVSAVLLVSLLVGKYVLAAFGIDLTSFRIAGNLLVASIGWAMLTAKTGGPAPGGGSSPTVVPLAIPIIAGPGAISLVITFAEQHTGVLNLIGGAIAVLVVAAAIAVVLFFAPRLQKILGNSGMNILSRIFGLILLAIAVQSIIDALTDAFPVLTR